MACAWSGATVQAIRLNETIMHCSMIVSQAEPSLHLTHNAVALSLRKLDDNHLRMTVVRHVEVLELVELQCSLVYPSLGARGPRLLDHWMTDRLP